jgi:hypothetical protein
VYEAPDDDLCDRNMKRQRIATIKINIDISINFNLILLDLLTNCFVDDLPTP